MWVCPSRGQHLHRHRWARRACGKGAGRSRLEEGAWLLEGQGVLRRSGSRGDWTLEEVWKRPRRRAASGEVRTPSTQAWGVGVGSMQAGRLPGLLCRAHKCGASGPQQGLLHGGWSCIPCSAWRSGHSRWAPCVRCSQPEPVHTCASSALSTPLCGAPAPTVALGAHLAQEALASANREPCSLEALGLKSIFTAGSLTAGCRSEQDLGSHSQHLVLSWEQPGTERASYEPLDRQDSLRGVAHRDKRQKVTPVFAEGLLSQEFEHVPGVSSRVPKSAFSQS